MNKAIHLHFAANLGQRAGNFHVGVMKRVVGLVRNEGELFLRNGLARFVVLAHHIDDYIGIGNAYPQPFCHQG